MDHARSARTISADPTWQTLRAEMNRALSEMEGAHRSIGDFPPELVKLGVALFLPLAGPADTIANLIALMRQIGEQFPGSFDAAIGMVAKDRLARN